MCIVCPHLGDILACACCHHLSGDIGSIHGNFNIELQLVHTHIPVCVYRCNARVSDLQVEVCQTSTGKNNAPVESLINNDPVAWA